MRICIQQCCGSGMFIPDPDFYPSRIWDLGSRIQKQQQKTGVKKNLLNHFCSHKFHKTQFYFIFDMLKKKIWPNFPRIIEVFTQKIVTKPSNIWGWDPGSGKTLFRIPDSGVKKAPEPGSGSATLASRMQHFFESPDPQARLMMIHVFPDPANWCGFMWIRIHSNCPITSVPEP